MLELEVYKVVFLQAMFERTLMSAHQLKACLVEVNTGVKLDDPVLESRTLVYLSQCYVRASKEKDKVRYQYIIFFTRT